MTSGYRRLPLREPAAVHRDERGFTVVEVMVALFILSVGLVSLAYTASIGFGYTARARVRVDAVALANQTLEETRGLSREVLARGLSAQDLSDNPDPNIVTCGSERCYPFEGTNEVLVVSSDFPDITPVNPHVGSPTTTPPLPKVGPTSFTRSVYLTYPPGTGGESIHIIVVVSWPRGGGGAGGSVTVDSLVENTSGCPALDLHPFGGPCADYIKATAEIKPGSITIRPRQVTSTTGQQLTTCPGPTPFLNCLAGRATILLPRLRATMSSEQALSTSGLLITSGLETYTGTDALQSRVGGVAEGEVVSNGEGVEESGVIAPVDAAGSLKVGPATGGSGSNLYQPTFLRLVKPQMDSPASGKLATSTPPCYTSGALATLLGCSLVESSTRRAYWTSEETLQQLGPDSLAANLAVKTAASGQTPAMSFGDCRVVRAEQPLVGEPQSSVYIHRTAATQVEATITVKYPQMGLGCIPSGQGLRALSISDGYQDARGLLELSDLTETLTVSIGSAGINVTKQTRSGNIRYFSAASDSYPVVTLTNAAANVPEASITVGTGPSVCWTIPAFQVPALPTPSVAEQSVSASLVDPFANLQQLNVKFNMSGACSNGATQPVDLDIQAQLGSALIEGTYVPGSA